MVRYASERETVRQADHRAPAGHGHDRGELCGGCGRARHGDGWRQKIRRQGKDATPIAAATKMWCTEMVGRVADRAVQVHGRPGYIADYAVERFDRDVRILRLYAGHDADPADGDWARAAADGEGWRNLKSTTQPPTPWDPFLQGNDDLLRALRPSS